MCFSDVPNPFLTPGAIAAHVTEGSFSILSDMDGKKDILTMFELLNVYIWPPALSLATLGLHLQLFLVYPQLFSLYVHIFAGASVLI